MTFVVGCCDVAGVSGGKDSRFGSVSRLVDRALISPALSHRRFDLRSFARLSFFRPSFLFGESAQTRHETFSRQLSEQRICQVTPTEFWALLNLASDGAPYTPAEMTDFAQKAGALLRAFSGSGLLILSSTQMHLTMRVPGDLHYQGTCKHGISKWFDISR